MYSSYSPLQRTQLSGQVYTDTQSLYLLVYAPGRRVALENTLRDQLHQKFRLVDSLADALPPAVAGVLLVREDVELMSTALNYFAAALKDGADLVLSDAVFGYNGATALYQSDAHISCTGCALVSRALLDRCRATAKDPESVSELLDAAARLSERCTRVPQALLHFERDICAEDAYSLHGKRAFLISHVLDMTGAPIVMVSAVPVLRSMGYEVTVLGPSDNGSLQLFRDAGAAVITRAGCVSSPALWGLALCADFVIVNTVVSGRVLRALSDTGVPVLWWLHDAFAGYPHIAHQIPKTIAPNVEVYSVGKHAAAAMHAVRPEFEIKQLIYGLPDYSKEDFPVYDLGYANGRPLFVTVGSFERRKGQDIFCKAIRLLPPEVRQKASFLFVGKAADREMMDAVAAFRVLSGEDVQCQAYVARFTGEAAPVKATAPSAAGDMTLDDAIIKGLKADAGRLAKQALETESELTLVEQHLIPALDQVGEAYEKGKMFLPQLLSAAQAAQSVFEVIRAAIAEKGGAPVKKGRLIIATVQGDIHDIGKNIVKTVLENYGYEVLDLGRDVAPETIVETAVKENIRLVGLSALMTTTLPAMEETIRQLRELPEPPVTFVGGAVVTPEYAEKMGADYYARDARQSVEIARKVLG